MSKKLLLADDSVVIQKLVGLSFANEDIEILYTDNGDDAVDKARALLPDIILADVVMPGKSGYEVCEAIKQDPTLAHIPVLLLTGTFEAFDETRAANAGADGQITKPFEAQALVSRVTEVLRAFPPAPASTPTESLGSEDFFDADVESLATTLPPLPERSFEAEDTNAAAFDRESSEIGWLTDASSSSSDLFDDWDLDSSTDAFALSLEGDDEAPAPTSSIDESVLGAISSPPPLPPQPEQTRASSRPTLPPTLPPALPVEPPALPTLEPDPTPRSTPPSLSTMKVDSAQASGSAQDDAAVLAAARDERLTNSAGSDRSRSHDARSGRGAQDSDFLDLGPSSLDAEDLDFSFDVSEQRSVEDLDDLLEQSFSPRMEVSEPQVSGRPDPSDPLAASYDVSSSDLATFAGALPPRHVEAPAPLAEESRPTAADEPGPVGAHEPRTLDEPELDLISIDPEDSFSGGLAEDSFSASPVEDSSASRRDRGFFASALDAASEEEPSTSESISDLSPMMQQRIQETLEKVAWEAFSDLSESIVKQVMTRVEQIAWEVIPQMAETLVREEIRAMKGEED